MADTGRNTRACIYPPTAAAARYVLSCDIAVELVERSDFFDAIEGFGRRGRARLLFEIDDLDAALVKLASFGVDPVRTGSNPAPEAAMEVNFICDRDGNVTAQFNRRMRG